VEGILTRISSHTFKLKKIKHYQATVEIYTAGAYTGRGYRGPVPPAVTSMVARAVFRPKLVLPHSLLKIIFKPHSQGRK